MNKIKTAVIGVGYLGYFHAQKHFSLPECDLVAVVDKDKKKADKIANELKCQAYNDYRDVLGQVDAVCIASDTISHFEIAKDCLKNNIHCFIEKPITSNTKQAEELEQIMKKNNLVIQVGFLERFNPALIAVCDKLKNPSFIESHRIATFNPRGTDVNVVLDLMIHDIDIILHIIKSKIKHVSASGAAFLTSSFDIANARIEFENGTVANITASRISSSSQRKMRFFQKNNAFIVDFSNKQSIEYFKNSSMPPSIKSKKQQHDSNDTILIETKEFFKAIKNNTPPPVTCHDGKNALEVAEYITHVIQNRQSAKQSTN
jgi:predicted dehydrogenase